MPNWANTFYIVTGDREQRQKLYDIMSELEEMKHPGLHDNGFGSSWLGNLVIKLGGDWEKIYCRGQWFDLCNYDDRLTFDTETAWGEMNEVRYFLKSKFPKLDFYYLCEEPGMVIYITNDRRHKYFPERFYMWVEDREEQYYLSLKALCDMVQNITGKEDLKSFRDCRKALDKFCGDDISYSLERVKVVDY